MTLLRQRMLDELQLRNRLLIRSKGILRLFIGSRS